MEKNMLDPDRPQVTI